jgi:hypothetical protein
MRDCSYGGYAWGPCVGNTFDFLDELSTCDLCRTDPMLLVCCYWRMLIWVVERISQKHDVRGLQGSERLDEIRNITYGPMRVLLVLSLHLSAQLLCLICHPALQLACLPCRPR